MSALPSVVVLDLGKVLVDFDYSIAARRIAARSSRVVDNSRFFAEHAPLLYSYELGQISTETFFEAMRAATGFAGSLAEFGDSFSDIFTPIQPMIELQAEVRRKGFPVHIFSNTNELAVSQIGRHFPFYHNFDGYILSYEHGALKPDAKLYRAVEQQTGCRSAEILYLDDRPENVAAGLDRGWQAVLHESSQKSRAAFERLGVLNA
jgi:FMN phosphatase YigB (HAD superfamily)